MVRCRQISLGMVAFYAVALALVDSARVASQTPTRAPVLSAEDVRQVIVTAAGALADETMAVAVVDRSGSILGVYVRPRTSTAAADIAVSLAHRGVLQQRPGPLSSRTVRRPPRSEKISSLPDVVRREPSMPARSSRPCSWATERAASAPRGDRQSTSIGPRCGCCRRLCAAHPERSPGSDRAPGRCLGLPRVPPPHRRQARAAHA